MVGPGGPTTHNRAAFDRLLHSSHYFWLIIPGGLFGSIIRCLHPKWLSGEAKKALSLARLQQDVPKPAAFGCAPRCAKNKITLGRVFHGALIFVG
ncbi:MAG: hypothetical protein Q9205_001239 [Flavoplaca limonia]